MQAKDHPKIKRLMLRHGVEKIAHLPPQAKRQAQTILESIAGIGYGMSDGRLVNDKIEIDYHSYIAKENDMGINHSAAVLSLTDTVKMVGVIFDADPKAKSVDWDDYSKGSTVYHYKTTHLDLKAGDRCVVEARGDYQVVLVVDEDATDKIPVDGNVNYKWIIDVVDFDAHRECIEKEEDLLTRLRMADRKRAREKMVVDYAESLGMSVDELKQIGTTFGDDGSEVDLDGEPVNGEDQA